MLLDQTTPKKSDSDVYLPVKEHIIKELIKKNNISQISGFTLTLKKKFHNDDDKWLMRFIERKINKSRIWKNKEYIIFPEYTKNGILHFHGCMYNEYHHEVMRCMKWWRREFGFVKPELTLSSYSNWIKYITKDYGKTGLWTIYKLNNPRNQMDFGS